MKHIFACLLLAGVALSAQAQIYLPDGGQIPAAKQQGIMKSADETFYYNCKLQRKTLRLGQAGDRTTYRYDGNGRVVESLYYMFSETPLRHQYNEYDAFGQRTRNILLDENVDTLINCRYSHTYDSLSNPLATSCTCDEETEYTSYKYAFFADSIVRETFENGALQYRDVYDKQGRIVRAYSHISNGQFTMLQISDYTPDTKVSPDGLERYSDVYLYSYNAHGDKTCKWELSDGKWIESARYECVYDSQNNWISRTIIRKGSTTYVKRNIQY